MPHATIVVHELARTGAPIYALRQMHALQRSGWTISLVAKEGGALIDEADLASSTVGIDVLETGHVRRLPSAYAIDKARQALQRFSPDVIYVHSIASAEFCEAAQLTQLPCVLHIHEMPRLMGELEKTKLFNRSSKPPLAALLAVSKQSLKRGRRWFRVPRRASFVVQNTIDVKAVRAKAHDVFPDALNLQGQAFHFAPSAQQRRPLIMMCGPTTKSKGILTFLEAASLRPDWDFLWVGPIVPLDHTGKLFRDFIDGAEPPNIYFTKSVKNPAPWIGACDIFAFTSSLDASPTVVLEALALGRPVIAFKAGIGDKVRIDRFGVLLEGRPDPYRLIEAADHILTGKSLFPECLKTQQKALIASLEAPEGHPDLDDLLRRLIS